MTAPFSIALLIAMLLGLPALMWLLRTWSEAMTARHADRAVMARWKQSAFDGIGTAQILVACALLLFGIEQGDLEPFWTSAAALVPMGLGFIFGPRYSRRLERRLGLTPNNPE